MVKDLKPTKKWLSFDNQKILHTKCAIVDPNNLNEKDMDLIAKMQAYIDYSYERSDDEKLNIVPGIAIAANQLGVAKQMVYIHFNEDGIEHRYFLMNPRIVSNSLAKTYIKQGEGCLSVNDEYEGVSVRYAKIKVKAYDYFNKKDIEINADGMLAICLQHEIDHLNGLLFYDRITADLENATVYKPKQKEK